MGTMVVGIFPDHDSLIKLTDALKSNGLSVDQLRVISSETPTDHLIRTGVQFNYSGEAEYSAIGSGGALITAMGGGTDVPGLTDYNPTLESLGSRQSVEDLLMDFDIPGARFEDYAKALDDERSIAGYPGGPNVERVKALFSSAGGNPVDVF
jgi:hypothetical protein